MEKIIFHLFLVLLAYWFIPSPVRAAGEFDVNYDVFYAVSPTGTTIVTQHVTLTNKQTNLYAKQYSILLDTTSIKNVIAYDKKGVISPKVTFDNGKTTILLTFNDQVVGIGKQLDFSLRFENRDIAQKNGSIWEINIPGIADDPDVSRYGVSLQVPPSFGPNAYTVPAPAEGGKWNKAQMIKGGISAAYGKSQLFSVVLSYYLENPAIDKRIGTITIPPDTAYQKVRIESLDPKPTRVTVDPDGNWIAEYRLNPTQKLDITAKLTVSIDLFPRSDYQISSIDQATYTKPDTYWETQNLTIRELAKTYTTPRAIYDYVVDHLSYDETRATQGTVRKGAVEGLKNPKNSVCMEFTDLFIAIARAAGIPARQVVGYAYTNNPRLRPLSLVTDVLHAWPEYYDQERNLWIPVDPTWANTTRGVNYFDKLDFNHIVFAINGISSITPYAAGSFRKAGKIGRDVKVEFGSSPVNTNQSKEKLITSFEFPTSITAGFATQGFVIVTNESGTSVKDANITIQSTPIPFLLTKHEQSIPPYAVLRIPILIKPDQLLARGKGTVTVTVNNEVAQWYYTIEPLYWLIIPVGIGGVCLIIGLWLFVAKPVFLWTRLKKH